MRTWIVTGTSMVVEAEDAEDAVLRAEQSSGWHWEATPQDQPEVSLFQFEARASDDDLKRALELTCTQCNEVLCDIEDGDSMGTLVSLMHDHACKDEEVETIATCQHCGREIGQDADGIWVDPEATGDDRVWRETCDENHNDRIAAHEPGGEG